MEVRWPKVSAFFLGAGSVGMMSWGEASFCCGSAEAKPRRKLAAIVLSSESYISFPTTVLSVLPAVNCGGAWAVGAAVAAEVAAAPPRKSSNLGTEVNMERLVGATSLASVVVMLLLPKTFFVCYYINFRRYWIQRVFLWFNISNYYCLKLINLINKINIF